MTGNQRLAAGAERSGEKRLLAIPTSSKAEEELEARLIQSGAAKTHMRRRKRSLSFPAL